MFEPDKAAVLRSIAILMLAAYLIRKMEELGHPRPKITQPTGNWRMSLFLPVLLFAGSYILSCILSATPRASIWGGYDRSQGLYTFAAYLVVFFLAATHIKTREQVERIFTTVILTCIPIAAYGIIQRVGWDPVPWQQMDPSKRASATMGNPVFLAAYLVIAIPLVVTRLTKAIYQKKPLFIILYILPILLLTSALILTRSIFPLLALLCGIFIFLLILGWRYKTIWLLTIAVNIPIVIIALFVVFNLPAIITGAKFSEYSLPDFVRAEIEGGRGKTRLLMWQGNMQLITDSPYRFVFGYGPESLATVYYKVFTMELTKYEGLTVHADRAHNVFLDAWVMQGLIGLIAYLFLLSSILYLGLKSVWQSSGTSPPDRQYLDNLLQIGLVSAIITHIVEGFFGIPITATTSYFWIYAAALYALNKIKLEPYTEPEVTAPEPAPVPTPAPEIPPPLETTPSDLPPVGDALQPSTETSLTEQPQPMPKLPEIDWTMLPRYLFWAYIGFSLLLQIILMRYYWPNENTNTDTFITNTYIWLFIGLILGALAIKSHLKPTTWTTFIFSPIYLILIIVALFGIYKTNLEPIRADGYYKFCFSYDGGAEQLTRNPPPNMKREVAYENAYRTRFASIPYYIKALKLNPSEKNYLNGAGRNFLELVKLQQMLPANSSDRIPDVQNKLSKPPSMEELLKIPIEDYSRFTGHDFFLCCVTVIEEAYQLEPNNYERILAMIRVNRFWGQIEKDPSKLLRTLEFCREASIAAPLHDTPHREVKEILYYLELLEK
jgi:O-antigen ligase